MKGLLHSHDPAELRKIIDYLGIVAFVIDVGPDDSFRLAAINERHEQLTGLRHAQVAGSRVDEVLAPEEARLVEKRYRQCVQQRAPIDYQEKLELPIGTTYWRTFLVPFMDAGGRVFRMLGTAFEISHTVHLELETQYQSTLLNVYLEESPDGILVVDADNHMKSWNRRFLEIWDIPEAVMQAGDGAGALEAVRKQLREPDDFIDRVMGLYNHLDQMEAGYRFEMRDGRIFERYSRGLRDRQGTYWGRIWFYRDITQHEKLTEELRRLTLTDALTNTANRRAFMQLLPEEFRRARRYEHYLTALMIDLDHFKGINDQYGHKGGDQALKLFAVTVQPLLRETDHFARMGGEEFAILLPETDPAEGRQIAERIVRAVAGVTVHSERGSFGMTISIGVAEMQAGDTDAEEILNRADQALYAAKDAGRNRVECA